MGHMITELLKPSDVAAYLGCCVDTVYRAIKTGRLRAMRLGREYRIKKEWIDNGALVEVAVRHRSRC
jgi:excisionase family DNA binding protein